MHDAENGSERATAPFAYERGVSPSAEQIEVAEDLGCTEPQVREMQKNGMSYDDWTHIVPAEAMLRHLEAKYPAVEFEAAWITAPSTLDSEYTLGCEAHAASAGMRQECEVEAWQDDDGRIRYAEDYFCTAKQGEYLAWAEGFLHEVAERCGVPSEAFCAGASLIGSYDESFDARTDLGERLPDLCGSLRLYVSGAANLDEGAYRAFVDAAIEEMRAQGFQGDYEVDYLPAFPQGSDFNPENAEWVMARPSSEAPASQWHVGGVLEKAVG